ncbi:MAG: anti-sigma factor [Candidatus Omnitrophica bacterium]|nr:anti-sigma factor [Candidatus Omnitrophota bacterium]
MNECRKFRDVILTDYLDGELDKESRERLEAHLSVCTACRIFAREAKEQLGDSFKEVRPEPVPEELWRNIRGRIEAENRTRDIAGEILERVFKPFLRPQLVPAYIVFLVFFFSGAFVAHNRIKLVTEIEQGRYLMSTLGEEASAEGLENANLGTAIEEYFL